MDQVHVIRHKVLVEDNGIRRTAREVGVSRNTVRKYLNQTEAKRVEKGPRNRPVLEKVKCRLNELLAEWSERTTKKQRITATRLHRQLTDDGFQVGITTVKDYWREWKRQRREVYIPLIHRPGEAQVDFFEATIEVEDVRLKVWKFVMRLMYSGRDFVWLYEHADLVSLLDGHVRAFEHFGGYPTRTVYDNLKPVVKKMLVDGRQLTDGFLRFTSHYLFEPSFTRRGEGHDKGGVEGRGKSIRLQHLVPIPKGPSVEAIAERLLVDVDGDMDRRCDVAGRAVALRFAEEKALLKALPPVAYDVRRVVVATVNSKALVRVDSAEYSVASGWAGLDATVYVGVREIEIRCRGESEVYEKEPRGTRTVRYRHYLSELGKKPQAVRQVAPELIAELGEPFGRFWALLEGTHGPMKAARVLAAVIAAVVEFGEENVRLAVKATLEAGDADFLDLARRLRPESSRPKIEVPERLASFQVEQASSKNYDHLLTN